MYLITFYLVLSDTVPIYIVLYKDQIHVHTCTPSFTSIRRGLSLWSEFPTIAYVFVNRVIESLSCAFVVPRIAPANLHA